MDSLRYGGGMARLLLPEKQIGQIARRHVTSVLREILSDPDVGLVLQKKTVVRLRRSLKSKRDGRMKDLTEVLKKYRP